MEKYKLGLSMIVKNEHHVIERLLNSVYKHIDYWIVVDTGSDDDTQNIIKNFFTVHNIPGRLIQSDWKDFSTARNLALEETEKCCEWGFWIDADEEFIPHENFDMKLALSNGVNQDTLSISTKYGAVEYTRKNIWRCGKGYRWKGPIHEVLQVADEKPGGLIMGCHVLVKAEGSSWNNIQEKYAQHAKILEKYTEEDNDPRWVFYTAQSYRDSGNFIQAIDWYRKRANITDRGYSEEIYISKLMIAKMAEILSWPKADVIHLYNEAHNVDSERGEAVKGLVKYLQEQKDWELAYVYSKYGLRYDKKSPYPSRVLFIDHKFYDYQALEYHSLSCFYTNRKLEASETYWEMRRNIPKSIEQEQLKIILENEKYFIPFTSTGIKKPKPKPKQKKRR